MNFTKSQLDGAYHAARTCILAKIRSQVPSMFENYAEGLLPQHEQDVRDIVDAALQGLGAPRP